MQQIKTDYNGPSGQRLSWSVLIWLAIFLMPSACQTQQVTSDSVISTASPRLVPLHAGRFLAARQASYFNDVNASADFYLNALRQDEHNPELLQQGFLTQYRNGNIGMAAALARQLEGINIKAPFTVEPAIAQAGSGGDGGASKGGVDNAGKVTNVREIGIRQDIREELTVLSSHKRQESTQTCLLGVPAAWV